MIERPKPDIRIGIGTDIHELVTGRALMLCGVQVPYPQGLLGHSDGDVAIHAIIDALLGAAAMGDIGDMFPDNDEKWKDADSMDLLFLVKEEIFKAEWDIANIDVIIHAEEPKLGPHKMQMKRTIAGVLELGFDRVNIKAKTNEGFGDVGAGDAIAATATALLKKKFKRTL